ncbi:MAG: hypothetical protein ACPLRJ_07950, partial [Infirmifilum uzonense]|uniref:hypothetical protein n=1 Tax=Infirmifilum uzonense TaxID=1550241 RepID=UPI003C76D259
GRKASILLGVGGVYPAFLVMLRDAFMSALISRPHRWHGEALDAYSRALSLAGGSTYTRGESRAMQAWQVDHARRAYHALSEVVEEVNIRRTHIAPLRIYARHPPRIQEDTQRY